MFIGNHYDLFLQIEDHTFSVGDPISIIGGVFSLSSAINVESSNFIGIVCRVVDNGVYIRSFGALNIFNGLTPGTVYYLSNTPGEYSTNPGTIAVPMFIAVNSTDAIFYQKSVIGGGGGGGASTEFFSESKTLNDSNISSKSVSLTYVPTGIVSALVVGGLYLVSGYDFTISGSLVSWDTYPIESILEESDILVFNYARSV